MFEAGADNELGGRVPTTDDLYRVLRASVAVLGPAGLAQVVATFAVFELGEFRETDTCRTFAYRLALSFWYAGARSRPMTAGEAAVALYLSDAYRHHQVDAVTARRAPLLVSRAIRQGAALLPTPTLMRLGEAMGREFAAPASPGEVVTAGRDWLYRQALPDYHRRRFCFALLWADVCQPSPLIVRLDGAGYALGATPPAGPDGTWLRPVRVGW
ncbi:hypothetical protein A8W25_20805 [Streptomyces sp. ERV7]|nr:hypothetical protein A8W25_20805 [Streptomyces sp. ERV7]